MDAMFLCIHVVLTDNLKQMLNLDRDIIPLHITTMDEEPQQTKRKFVSLAVGDTKNGKCRQ